MVIPKTSSISHCLKAYEELIELTTKNLNTAVPRRSVTLPASAPVLEKYRLWAQLAACRDADPHHTEYVAEFGRITATLDRFVADAGGAYRAMLRDELMSCASRCHAAVCLMNLGMADPVPDRDLFCFNELHALCAELENDGETAGARQLAETLEEMVRSGTDAGEVPDTHRQLRTGVLPE